MTSSMNTSNSNFTPARVVSVDIAAGTVRDPEATPADCADYRRVHALITLGPNPIGLATFGVSSGDSDAEIVQRARQIAVSDYHQQCEEVFGANGIDQPVTTDGFGAFRPAPTPTATPLVSVAIATLDDDDAVIATIKRILQNDYPNFEIVVVDNSSDPKALAQRLSHEFGSHEFANKTNIRHAHQPIRGLSHARNKGWHEAKGDIVVFTDNDVIVEKTWLSAIVSAFQLAPHVGCVTGAILPSELESPAQDLLEQYGGYNKGFSQQLYDNDRSRRDDPLYPYNAGRFGSGANMAITRTALEQLGGFAVTLGAGTPTHGGEDIDILQRVISGGFAIVYQPSALLWHRHRRAYSALRLQMYRYGVGLGATVTKWMLESRTSNFEILKRLPRGIAYMVNPRSQKNTRKSDSYPRSLTLFELLGLAVGPFAYFRSLGRHREALASGTQLGSLHEPKRNNG